MTCTAEIWAIIVSVIAVVKLKRVFCKFTEMFLIFSTSEILAISTIGSTTPPTFHKTAMVSLCFVRYPFVALVQNMISYK